MFPWSSVVSWLELCCPHRVTWSQQRSWDASSRSETSLPSSSLLLSVSLNAIMWLIWPWCCVSFVLFTVTLLNGKCVSVWCCRFPRVPDICAVWTHHPAGANSHTRHYEGTDYSCVFFVFCFSLSSSSFCFIWLLISFQFMMAVLVLSAILPPGSRHIQWIVSAGLAQVSEFSFVLGSRARRAGIISREVSDYLLC